MAKFSPPARKKTSVKTSLRVPVNMLKRLHDEMAETGYNKKQRSTWIDQAVTMLLNRPDYPNLVAEEFIVPGSTESIPVSLSENSAEKLNDALNNVARTEEIKKDRSAIIRTAIIQRLLAQSGLQVSPQETLSQATNEE